MRECNIYAFDKIWFTPNWPSLLQLIQTSLGSNLYETNAVTVVWLSVKREKCVLVTYFCSCILGRKYPWHVILFMFGVGPSSTSSEVLWHTPWYNLIYVIFSGFDRYSGLVQVTTEYFASLYNQYIKFCFNINLKIISRYGFGIV